MSNEGRIAVSKIESSTEETTSDMGYYEVTATVVVRVQIEADSQRHAQDLVEEKLNGTMSWQAWGEGNEDEHLKWIDEYPIVTSCI